jgi:hypothetical protein
MMSKNSEISKEIDPKNSDETNIGKATIEAGTNGQNLDVNEEGDSNSVQNQDSIGEETALTTPDGSTSEPVELKESDKKEEAPEESRDSDTSTPKEDEATPITTKEATIVIAPESSDTEEPIPSDSDTPASTPPVVEEKAPGTTPDREAMEVSSEQPQGADTATQIDAKTDTEQTETPESELPTQTSNDKDVGSKKSEEDQPETKETPKPWDGVEFKSLNKSELVKYIELVVKEDDPLLANRVAKQLKSFYDNIHQTERQASLDKFVADGNDPDHFAYKFDDLDNRFDGAFKLIRDRKSQHIKHLERSKESNLAEKVNLLETLRALVDEEETTSSIQAVKKIQEQWRSIGPVPGQHVKTLWANYHALMDRYYDQRSIYFELKELDRKKNLEAKLELCEKAEKLQAVENLKQAINDLNELHEEFKHIGPVPQSEQQALWERFKLASDKIYARRKEFIKHLKEDLKENLDKKVALAEQVQEFLAFNSDRINEWNKRTKAILELQKKWDAVGGLPRDQAKEINRKFWGAFKGFFQNKSSFFKKLEGERVTNLEKKQQLVAQAESLKDSKEWNETAEKLKALQKEWRNIGPVPEKHRNAIYKQFKEACDSFFNNRRSQNQELEKDYIENLKLKQRICMDIESMTTAGDFDLDKFLNLKQKFTEIGYVPASQVKQIRSQFTQTANDFLAAVPDELKDEARQIKYDIQFEKLKKGPHADRRKDQKVQSLRREISTLENDIATWKNNLEFFASSQTANKLKEEFTVKIEKAGKQLNDLKSQLRALRQL